MATEDTNRLIAWCISLEGSIELVIQSSRSSYCPYLKLYNTDVNIVNQFYEIMGRKGFIVRSEYKNPKFKPCYAWRCCKMEDVKNILGSILPYLPSKKEQAELLIEYITIREDNKYKWHLRGSSHSDREREIHLRIKELNKRGKIEND